MTTILEIPAPVNSDPIDAETIAPYTASDESWWAEETRDDAPEPDWDAMAYEALAQDLLERGLCC